MKDLFDIVSERPIEEEPDIESAICPYCGATFQDLIIRCSFTTDMAYTYTNYNRVWYQLECTKCAKTFIRSNVADNVWYTTREHELVKGVPSSAEYCLYHCAKCGGPVRRHYIPWGSVITALVDGEWTKEHRIVFRCDTCGHGGETEQDFWRSNETPKASI